MWNRILLSLRPVPLRRIDKHEGVVCFVCGRVRQYDDRYGDLVASLHRCNRANERCSNGVVRPNRHSDVCRDVSESDVVVFRPIVARHSDAVYRLFHDRVLCVLRRVVGDSGQQDR